MAKGTSTQGNTAPAEVQPTQSVVSITDFEYQKDSKHVVVKFEVKEDFKETDRYIFLFDSGKDKVPANLVSAPKPLGNADKKKLTCTISASEDIIGYAPSVGTSESEMKSATTLVASPFKLESITNLTITDKTKFKLTNQDGTPEEGATDTLEAIWDMPDGWKATSGHTFEFRFIKKSNSFIVNVSPGDVTQVDQENRLKCTFDLKNEASLTNKSIKDDYLLQIKYTKDPDESDWTTELNWYYLVKAEVELFENNIVISAESGQTRYGLDKPFVVTYPQFQRGLKKSFKYDLPNEVAGRDLTKISLAINELDMDTKTKEVNVAVVANLNFDILPGILQVKKLGIAVRRMNTTIDERKEEQKKLTKISERAALKNLPVTKLDDPKTES